MCGCSFFNLLAEQFPGIISNVIDILDFIFVDTSIVIHTTLIEIRKNILTRLAEIYRSILKRWNTSKMELNEYNYVSERHASQTTTERHASQATTAVQSEESRKASQATVTADTEDAQGRAWTWRVIVMTLLVSVGGMIFGYGGIGTVGGFLAMQDYNERFGTLRPSGHYTLGDTRTGFIVGFLMIGALMGSLVAGPIADKIGRKKSISLWSAFYMLGAIIEITSMTAYPQIVVGRTIEGIGIGGLSILVPMYQSECTPKQVRGVIISMYQLFITLGILLASCVNLGTKNIDGSASWRITIGIGMLWPLILGIGIQCLDESPRWAIRSGRADLAEGMLRKMYSSEAEVRRELDEMEVAVLDESQQEKATVMGIFRERTILQRFLIGMVLQMMQQLTGINYFFYFGTILFGKLHVGDSFVTFSCPAGGLMNSRSWPPRSLVSSSASGGLPRFRCSSANRGALVAALLLDYWLPWRADLI